MNDKTYISFNHFYEPSTTKNRERKKKGKKERSLPRFLGQVRDPALDNWFPVTQEIFNCIKENEKENRKLVIVMDGPVGNRVRKTCEHLTLVDMMHPRWQRAFPLSKGNPSHRNNKGTTAVLVLATSHQGFKFSQSHTRKKM